MADLSVKVCGVEFNNPLIAVTAGKCDTLA